LAPFFSIPPAPPDASTLSLHDALPILPLAVLNFLSRSLSRVSVVTSAHIVRTFHIPNLFLSEGKTRRILRSLLSGYTRARSVRRSEEHTSELQSRENLVCRLLLEKKKQ